MINTCVEIDHSLPQATNGDIEIFTQIFPLIGSTSIGLSGKLSFSLSANIVTVGTFDAWTACFSPRDINIPCTFDPPHSDNEMSVAEPGVGQKAITVGSHVTRNCWPSISAVGLECTGGSRIGDISFFSSVGPTRDGRMKPDIAAPGDVIVSTLASSLTGDNVFPDFLIVPDNQHVVLRGTSMATPHVAGAAALLLAVNPNLDADQVKTLLQANAFKDAFTGAQCNNTWGCGKLNIANIAVLGPIAPSLVFPENHASLNTGTPRFDWDATTGDVVEYLLQVTSGDIKARPFVIDAVISGDPPSTDFQVQTGDALADATYRWHVVATDRALNTASSVTRTFTVDTTPPGPPVLVAPDQGKLTNTTTPLFNWNASTGDVVDYRLRVTSGDIDAGAIDIDVVIAGDPPVTEFQVPAGKALADATYSWHVTARDASLNTASSLTRTFTVDTVAPGMPLLFTPENGALVSTRTPLFVWEPSTGDVVSYLLQVTSGDLTTGPYDIDVGILHATTEFLSTVDLADANYSWRVVARDGAQNAAPSATWAFVVRLLVVRGRVALEGMFNPRTGAILTFSTGSRVFQAFSNPEDGSFEIELPSDTYDITVEKDGFLTATKHGTLINQDVTLSELLLLSGDPNGDGIVDVKDLVVPAKNQGKTKSPWP